MSLASGPGRIQIAVIGGREADPRLLRFAEEVGQLLARRGAVLICGGMSGIMEAACRGAGEAGGTTVGILPGERADEGNPYLDIVLPTGLGLARNVLVVRAADGVIAVGGRYGTLSEIACAAQLGIPLVLLESWHVDDSIPTAATPEEAVQLLFSLLPPSAGEK